MVIRRYPQCDLISVVWFYFDGRKTKKQANIQAELLIGQGKLKKTSCRSQWRINEKAGRQFRTEKREKIRKICRNDLQAFVLRNYSKLLKISQLPSKLRLSANCIFFGQSFSLEHYPSIIYQPPKGIYLLCVYIYIYIYRLWKWNLRQPKLLFFFICWGVNFISRRKTSCQTVSWSFAILFYPISVILLKKLFLEVNHKRLNN